MFCATIILFFTCTRRNQRFFWTFLKRLPHPVSFETQSSTAARRPATTRRPLLSTRGERTGCTACNGRRRRTLVAATSLREGRIYKSIHTIIFIIITLHKCTRGMCIWVPPASERWFLYELNTSPRLRVASPQETLYIIFCKTVLWIKRTDKKKKCEPRRSG